MFIELHLKLFNKDVLMQRFVYTFWTFVRLCVKIKINYRVQINVELYLNSG